MKLSAAVIIAFLILSALSCKKEKKQVNWQYLINKYSQNKSDSLKLQAVYFLRDNMNDLYSEKIIFYDPKTGKETDIHFDTIKNETSLQNVLLSTSSAYKVINVPDSLILSTQFIENNIDQSFDALKKYSWNEHLSKEAFFNYLLPYKVLNEIPQDWRTYFHDRYRDTVTQYITDFDSSKREHFCNITDLLFFRIYAENKNFELLYCDNPNYITNYPGLNEMLCHRNGNCNQISIAVAYAMRSVGVATAVSLVPLWGKKNGGHVTLEIMDSTGVLRCPNSCCGDDEVMGAAKVFRLSFKKQNVWQDSIKPVIGADNFYLPFLKNNHWIDVTAEHSFVSDVDYSIPAQYNASYAYICVLNYGQWQPLYWGKLDMNGQVLFRNMGCNVLYRVAVPDNDGLKTISDIIAFDINKKQIDFKTKGNRTTVLNARKWNTGSLSWIKKKDSLALYKWTNQQWQLIKTKKCEQDSLTLFKNVPERGLYVLKRLNKDLHNLERPFSIKNSEQYFW